MSEPSSLFARLPLRPADLATFRAAPTALPRAFPDWAGWVASREMWGGGITAEDIDALDGFDGATTGEVLDAWVADAYPFPGNAHAEYDEAAGLWTLTVIEFSENYLEWISWVSVLRGAAEFVRADGLIVVHDFLWGDTENDFAICMEEGGSEILDSPSASVIQAASDALTRRASSIEIDD